MYKIETESRSMRQRIAKQSDLASYHITLLIDCLIVWNGLLFGRVRSHSICVLRRCFGWQATGSHIYVCIVSFYCSTTEDMCRHFLCEFSTKMPSLISYKNFILLWNISYGKIDEIEKNRPFWSLSEAFGTHQMHHKIHFQFKSSHSSRSHINAVYCLFHGKMYANGWNEISWAEMNLVE